MAELVRPQTFVQARFSTGPTDSLWKIRPFFSNPASGGGAEVNPHLGPWKDIRERTERRILCQVCVKYSRTPHKNHVCAFFYWSLEKLLPARTLYAIVSASRRTLQPDIRRINMNMWQQPFSDDRPFVCTKRRVARCRHRTNRPLAWTANKWGKTKNLSQFLNYPFTYGWIFRYATSYGWSRWLKKWQSRNWII
jgi:hypothetical protein